MAPEEILGSADGSRRNFLKKVLAGTTFAVPVVASFSMEGLTPASALAVPCASNSTGPDCFPAQCSNMPTSECCRFAALIAIEIATFTQCLAGVFPEVQALLLGPLGSALAAMAEGLDKAKGDCAKKPARDQFKKASKELSKFKELVDRFCEGETADNLNAIADDLIGLITNLVNGVCFSFVPGFFCRFKVPV